MHGPPRSFEDLEELCDEASTAFEKGRFKRAAKLYLNALPACSDFADDGYRDSIREYLGVCYYRLDDFSEAARIDRETLDLLVERHNENNSDAVRIRHNLARDLSAIHDRDPKNNSAKLGEAIDLHRLNRRILQTSGRKKGDLLETDYSLAFDLAKLSKSSLDTEVAKKLLEEAAVLNENVVRVREQNKTKDALTIQSKHNFASVLYSQKKYTKAKELFLQNQHDIDAFTSVEKNGLDALIQSTDRHLAACCEATKDIDLSISRITAESGRQRKQKQRSRQSNDGASLAVVKANGKPKAEPDGKLWTLPADSTNANLTTKVVPTGLDTPLVPFRIEAPITGGIVTSGNYSGGAASGSARVLNGNVYANNIINYYYSHPSATNHNPEDHPQVPHLSFDIDPPFPEPSEIKRSKSQGHTSRDKSSLDPTQDPRPRSSSSARANKLSAVGSPRRSRSVSSPEQKLDEPKSNEDRRRSAPSGDALPGATAQSSSSSASREPRNRKRDSAGDRRSQQNAFLNPHPSSRSRSSSTTRSTGSGADTVVRVPPTMHSADKWFSDLREHAHALLHYDNDSKIPRRRRIRVAIIDSGLERPEVSSLRRADIRRHHHRLCGYKDFSREADAWTDSSASFHGTNCASILLQVAPHADLYIANVVKKSTGNPAPSSVGAALKWALEKDVDIISMSLGFDKMHEEIDEQIKLASIKHVLVFAAASNDGQNAPDGGVFPAWLSNVFSINSSDVSGDKSWFNPKNTDEKLNFMFLGEQISILGEDGAPLPGISRLTGTSFATPIAAGTAALVLDLVRMQNIKKEFPKIEPCLKTYEGMSSVFKKMSSQPSAYGTDFYNVRPWRMLGKKGPPLSRANEPNESKQWYTLLKVVECLAKFGDLDTGVTAS